VSLLKNSFCALPGRCSGVKSPVFGRFESSLRPPIGPAAKELPKSGGSSTASLFANISDKFGPRAKARQWSESMTGRTFKTGEKFDTDELLGEVYHLTVTNVEKNGKTYSEVTSINKIRKRKTKDMDPATEQDPGADKKVSTEAVV
jgi:hypothetical protein